MIKNRKATGELERILKNRSLMKLQDIANRMAISVKIYDGMIANNFTLKEFADKMGRSVSEIEHYFDGTCNFSIDILTKFEVILNIKLLNTEL